MTAVDLGQVRDTADRRFSSGWIATGLWLVVLVTLLAAGLTPLTTGVLAGSDDYMRFVRVFAWLDGAGWYDQVIDRLNAPQGAVVPWSRLVDLPLAAIVAALSPLVGRVEAAMIAATLLPALLLLGLMHAAILLCRPAVGARAALLGAVIAVLLPNLVTAMMPGRVDHHTWQLVLMALAIGSLAYAVADPNRSRPAFIAGALFGVSLWVGGETVPWLAMANAALALIWILHGPRIAHAGRNFGLGFAITCAVAFPLARDPAVWLVPACDTLSLSTLGLAAAVAGFWLAVATFGRSVPSPIGRAGLGALCAGIIGGAWIFAFPSCAAGPYGDIDQQLVDSWLPTIAEAQSLPGYALVRPGTAVAMTLSPLIGCIGACFAAIHATNARRRRIWILYSCLILGALALAVWQIRVLPFANLFAIAPLAWVVSTAWRAIDRKVIGFGKRLSKVAVLLGVGPLGTAFGALDTLHAQSEAASSDIAATHSGACDLASVSDALTPVQFGKPPVIAAPVDLGAELLFRTIHGVIGGPYHRNADGILDSQAIFGGTDMTAVRHILQSRGAAFVVTCPGMDEMQLYAGGDGIDTFSERLAQHVPPAWLTPIRAPKESGVLAFRLAE